MNKIKTVFLSLLVLTLVVSVSSCVRSPYPARYDYGYRYRRLPPPPPRVIVVRPAPRVVYRPAPPGHRYEKRNNARRSYQPRSNRNYRGGNHRSRSYGPR